VNKVVETLVQLISEEGPTMRAALAIAYNRALDSSEVDEVASGAYRRRVTASQSAFRHIFPFNRAEFPVGTQGLISECRNLELEPSRSIWTLSS